MPMIQIYLKNSLYLKFLNLPDDIRLDLRAKVKDWIVEEHKQSRKNKRGVIDGD